MSSSMQKGFCQSLQATMKKVKKCVNDAAMILVHGKKTEEETLKAVRDILEGVPQVFKDSVLGVKSKLGQTLLNHAIEERFSTVFHYLFKNFPVDINDNEIHEPKPPLHTACSTGLYDVAAILVGAGANTTLPSKKYHLTSKDQLEDIQRSKPPVFFAIRSDSVDILELLLQAEDSDRKPDHRVLFHLALEVEAEDCLTYLAALLRSTNSSPNNPDLLLLASQKGLHFVEIVLSIGQTFTNEFLTSNRKILHEYYRKVGLRRRRNIEFTCCEFTTIVLDNFNGFEVLQDELNVELIHILLMRMSKSKTRLYSCSPDVVEGFYQDIIDTMKVILRHQPDILQTMTRDKIQLYFSSTRTRLSSTKIANQAELMHFIKIVTFLIDHGTPCDVMMTFVASKMDEVLVDCFHCAYHISYRTGCDVEDTFPIAELAEARIGLINAFLSQNSPQEDKEEFCKSGDWLGHSSTLLLPHQQAFITRLLPVLHRHGLNINHLIWKDYIHGNTRFTPFQGLVRDFSGSISNITHWGDVQHSQLSVIILLARYWVDFGREVEDPERLREMGRLLGGLLGVEATEPLHGLRFGKGLRQADLTKSYLLTNGVLDTAGLFMHFMQEKHRVILVKGICDGYQSQGLDADVKTTIETAIRAKLYPRIYGTTLKEEVLMSIRKYLRGLPCPEAYQDSKSSFCRETRSGGADLEAGDLEAAMFVLQSRGLVTSGCPHCENRMQNLGLPKALVLELTGDKLMKNVLFNLWKPFL